MEVIRIRCWAATRPGLPVTLTLSPGFKTLKPYLRTVAQPQD